MFLHTAFNKNHLGISRCHHPNQFLNASNYKYIYTNALLNCPSPYVVSYRDNKIGICGIHGNKGDYYLEFIELIPAYQSNTLAYCQLYYLLMTVCLNTYYLNVNITPENINLLRSLNAEFISNDWCKIYLNNIVRAINTPNFK